MTPRTKQGTRSDAVRTRALLEERLGEVDREIEERKEAATPGGERPGFGKRAGDYVAQVVDDRTNNQVADSLGQTAVRIRRALERLDRGDYGGCTTCGRAVGAERLAAIPWAEQCIACESGAGLSLLARHR